MHNVIKYALAAMVPFALPVVTQAQAAPSFDCAKASTQVERMICDDSRVARLDSELASAYRIALRDSPWASANKRIRAEQQEWLVQRNQCRSTQCLRQLYKRRINELRAEVDGGSAGGNNSGGNSGKRNLATVAGVAANDVLNVRGGPGTKYRIVGALGNGDTVRNLGCQNQGSARWCQIEMMTDMRERGWVNARYLVMRNSSQAPAGGSNGGTWFSRLVGAADDGAANQLRINGFRNVAGFESGTNGYGSVWYNRSTRQCLQVIVVNGRVESALDIKTHPRCRG